MDNIIYRQFQNMENIDLSHIQLNHITLQTGRLDQRINQKFQLLKLPPYNFLKLLCLIKRNIRIRKHIMIHADIRQRRLYLMGNFRNRLLQLLLLLLALKHPVSEYLFRLFKLHNHLGSKSLPVIFPVQRPVLFIPHDTSGIPKYFFGIPHKFSSEMQIISKIQNTKKKQEHQRFHTPASPAPIHRYPIP